MLRSIKPWQHHRILPGIGRLAIDPRRKMPRSQCSKTVKFTTAIPAYCSPPEMRFSRSRRTESGLVRDMPRARYSGDFDPAQIPGAAPALRRRDDIANYRAAAAPKAVAFHPDHVRVFIVTGASNQ